MFDLVVYLNGKSYKHHTTLFKTDSIFMFHWIVCDSFFVFLLLLFSHFVLFNKSVEWHLIDHSGGTTSACSLVHRWWLISSYSIRFFDHNSQQMQYCHFFNGKRSSSFKMFSSRRYLYDEIVRTMRDIQLKEWLLMVRLMIYNLGNTLYFQRCLGEEKV
jgi:hypothetical protein